MSVKPSVPVSRRFLSASARLAITAPSSCVWLPTLISKPPLPAKIPVCPDRVVVALHLVAADAKAAATAARSPGVACTRIHTLLFAVVFVAILQAADGQVAPDIRRDLIAVDLRAFKYRIAAAGQVDVLSGIQRRFVPGGSIAFFAASGGVYAGRDGDARAIRTGGNTDPD
jgi:hypothetical protein